MYVYIINTHEGNANVNKLTQPVFHRITIFKIFV